MIGRPILRETIDGAQRFDGLARFNRVLLSPTEFSGVAAALARGILFLPRVLMRVRPGVDQWRETNEVYVLVSGAWQLAKDVQTVVSGSWKSNEG